MGGSSSALLQKVSSSLENGQKVDSKALKELFDRYDKNKNGVLEGAEVENFLNDLYEFVYARVTPKVANTVQYTHVAYQVAPSSFHQQGCKGVQYRAQHLVPNECTVLTVPPDSQEGVTAFKTNLMNDLDPNKDCLLYTSPSPRDA
eukprot:TRINITY_DN475_c0_g1_i1.p1 TRINITY_DN475_c0_g1~~TRINITY_DN475_c0_g1_i1.p1  ORF type:complete len:146 (-),score=34.39 TRINITY_DN475_c0_g1_i1:23-460(-)